MARLSEAVDDIADVQVAAFVFEYKLEGNLNQLWIELNPKDQTRPPEPIPHWSLPSHKREVPHGSTVLIQTYPDREALNAWSDLVSDEDTGLQKPGELTLSERLTIVSKVLAPHRDNKRYITKLLLNNLIMVRRYADDHRLDHVIVEILQKLRNR